MRSHSACLLAVLVCLPTVGLADESSAIVQRDSDDSLPQGAILRLPNAVSQLKQVIRLPGATVGTFSPNGKLFVSNNN
jgi:hypothetical protein